MGVGRIKGFLHAFGLSDFRSVASGDLFTLYSFVILVLYMHVCVACDEQVVYVRSTRVHAYHVCMIVFLYWCVYM